jgi:hypothetical protein
VDVRGARDHGGHAWYVASSPQLALTLATNRPIVSALVIAQLGIVFALSARVDRMARSPFSMHLTAASGRVAVRLLLTRGKEATQWTAHDRD